MLLSNDVHVAERATTDLGCQFGEVIEGLLWLGPDDLILVEGPEALRLVVRNGKVERRHRTARYRERRHGQGPSCRLAHRPSIVANHNSAVPAAYRDGHAKPPGS